MKIVYVSYPDGEGAGAQVLASGRQVLGLRPWLEERGHEVVGTTETGEELDEQLVDAEVLITTPFWPVYLGAERLARARRLRLVCNAGIGADHVDWDAARQRGVGLAEVTGSNVVSVAEQNVAQILAVVRNLIPAYHEARGGGWDVAKVAARAHDLEDKTVGLVGLGAIGARTALRLQGFDVRMLYTANHRRSPAAEATLGVRFARLPDLLADSDVVCLALPFSGRDRPLLDRDRLAAMKPGAWLVNTARGALVDTDALVAALESGQLAGYAGDTWHPQPAGPDHPWRSMPNHAMTIHYSGMTREAQRRIADGIREILTAYLDGERLPADYQLI